MTQGTISPFPGDAQFNGFIILNMQRRRAVANLTGNIPVKSLAFDLRNIIMTLQAGFMPGILDGLGNDLIHG